MKTLKVIGLITLSLLSVANVNAQKKKKKKKAEEQVYQTPKMPVDERSKLITYQEVVNVPGKSADEIYKEANKWMHSYFKNADKVIRHKDNIKKSILAKPRFRVLNPPDKNGTQLMGGIVKYTLIIEAKNGRFRYTLTNFNWKQPSYYPIERWLDNTAPTYQKRFAYFLQQVDKEANKTIEAMKNAIAKEKPKADDNW